LCEAFREICMHESACEHEDENQDRARDERAYNRKAKGKTLSYFHVAGSFKT
jgi:hypothetical protein